MASCKTTPTTSSFFVGTSYEGDYLFGSDIFTNEKDAIEFLDFLQTCDPSKFSFEMYKIKPSGKGCGFGSEYFTPSEQVESDTDNDYVQEEEVDLSHMTLKKYGKGYLLRTTSDDPLYGTKYFLGGFWMPKHKAWFFKTPVAYGLLDYGIIEMEGVTDSTGKYITEPAFDDEDEQQQLSDAESDYSVLTVTDEFTMADSDAPYKELKSFTLKKYGRGYMLYAPNSDHKYYGQKYLGEGFWNSKANGWFFQRHHLKALMNSRIKLVR